MDLFDQGKEEKTPLAVRMRPEVLSEFVGQEHVLGEGKILRRNIEADRLNSLIIWGPPGTGKTSLAEIISKHTGANFVLLNGSFCSSQDIKKVIISAKFSSQQGGKTLLFIDEIHRLNRLKQDILIQDTETQRVILMGATTYNPFFYINPALISRSLVCEFKPLTPEEIMVILKRALNDKERGLGSEKAEVEEETLTYLSVSSSGDARKALSALEIGIMTTPKDSQGKRVISLGVARESIQYTPAFYDKKGGNHYDVVSAFIKSVRGSDPDSALYWLARMLYSGEDPRFIARRMVILASEDIGLADPFALVLATSCFKAVEFVGMPEARIVLSETVLYLAQAEKSNSAYLAIEKAGRDIESSGVEEVPLHLKDTHYSQAEKIGRGKEYKYPHSFKGYVKQDYRKEVKQYYFPNNIGTEAQLAQRLKQFKLRAGKKED